MAMHTELWFPSVIWSAIIHSVNNDEIKKFSYEKQKQDKGRTISNYGGWQSNDITSGESDAINKLVEVLNKEVCECAEQVGLYNPMLYNIWININKPGSYNTIHNHSGAIFSGVYYVDATPEQGNIFFERSDNGEYHLPNTVAKQTYFNGTRANYASKTGALYIFPGWLRHGVDVNNSKSDRISVSFNYGERQ